MRNHRTLFGRLPFVIVFVLFAPVAVARQADTKPWTPVEDLWYLLEMMGTKAGWTHAHIETNGEQYRSTSETSMKINRGAMPIEITMKSITVETIDGKPVSMEMHQLMSLQSMESRWVFSDDGVEFISTQGGRETRTQQLLPAGDWLTPKAADRYARAQRESGAEEIKYRVLNPQNGLKPIGITSKRTGKETIELSGESIEVSVWTSTTDIMPIDATEKIDAKGRLVYQETTIPGLGKTTTQLTSKEEAMGVAGDAAPAPELLLQTFVSPNKPIADARKTVRSKLHLMAKSGKLPELPSAGAQRVTMSDDATVATLTVDINNNVEASAEDVANNEYLAASAMIDSSDELIQKLAKRALESTDGERPIGDDPMIRAEALRKFAHKYINRKGMQTAFASASETAKMRTGDCSEHGVFLAALLRAEGIPARVATGLVYADAFEGHEDIFGWHMWTQALIEGKWVDFDATLPVRYDAVHVLASTSNLAEGLGTADMVAVVQMLGNLEIDVIEVEHE